MMDLMSQLHVVCYCSIVCCRVVVIGLCVMDVGVNECPSHDTCSGDQLCVALPTRYICVCPTGFGVTASGCEGW